MTNRSALDMIEQNAVQQRIEDGKVFEVSSSQNIANAGGEGKWLFRTADKQCYVYARKVTSNGDELTYQAFKEPTVSADGTPLTVVKRNGNSSIAPTATVFQGPTTTADGDGIPPVYMPGASGQGQSVVGQFDREGFVRILEPNTTYMVQVTNDGAQNPAKVEWYLMWAEVD